MKILAIGNSFSQDSTAYLQSMAECGGFSAKVVNLYIGGCSLERHFCNLTTDERAYDVQLHGESTGEKMSIREGLVSDSWDIVTMQQVSGLSGKYESFQPYLDALSDYVTKYCPKAKKYLHETWAYEKDSTHGSFAMYGWNQRQMSDEIKAAYEKASQETGLPVIHVGDAIAALRENSLFDTEKGGVSLCRDGFHLNLIYGRYAAAAVWYKQLFGGSIGNNSIFLPCTKGEKSGGNIVYSSFLPPHADDEECFDERIKLIITTLA